MNVLTHSTETSKYAQIISMKRFITLTYNVNI